MKKNRLYFGVLLFFFAISAQAKIIQVNLQGIAFSPNTFTAKIGDTVKWVWVSGTHTTTSTSVPAGALSWNSPITSTSTSFLYVLKVAGNYSYKCTPHAALGMLGSFVVLPMAKIVAVKATAVNTCTNTNSLEYKCTQSAPPYRVQLYRYGKVYGSARSVPDTMPFTYSNLPFGSYYAIAKGHGGADSLSSKSGTNALEPVPAGLKTANITSTKATIKWTKYTCVKFYTVQYRLKGATTWIKINTVGNKDSINLTGLTVNSKYQYQVASADSANKIIATSKFSVIDSFMTKVSGIIALKSDDLVNDAAIDNRNAEEEAVLVYPNPASSQLKIRLQTSSFMSAVLRNTNGVIIWSELHQALLIKGKELNINLHNLPAGTYYLQMIDVNKKSIVKPVMVVK